MNGERVGCLPGGTAWELSSVFQGQWVRIMCRDAQGCFRNMKHTLQTCWNGLRVSHASLCHHLMLLCHMILTLLPGKPPFGINITKTTSYNPNFPFFPIPHKTLTCSHGSLLLPTTCKHYMWHCTVFSVNILFWINSYENKMHFISHWDVFFILLLKPAN